MRGCLDIGQDILAVGVISLRVCCCGEARGLSASCRLKVAVLLGLRARRQLLMPGALELAARMSHAPS